jgi:cyanate permease
MDVPLITTFVDRWRLKTHSSHLACGEMSVLMQDVGYILALGLDGPVVIGITDIEKWKDLMAEFTGLWPPDHDE